MRIQALYDQRAEARTQLQAILDRISTEGRARTPEEKAESDRLRGQVNALDVEIGELEAMRDELRSGALIHGGRVEDPNVAAEELANAASRSSASKATQVFPSLGHFLQAVKAAELGGENAGTARGQLMAAATGLGEAIDSEGGFLLPPPLVMGIESRMSELGEIMSRVDWTPVSGNSLVLKDFDETSRATGSRFGGVRGYWVDEGTAPTASNPKFREIQLKLRKVGAVGYATEELLADVSAMSSIYEEAFAEELLWLVEDSLMFGTGAGQPLGAVVSDVCIAVSAEAGQGAATVEYENILKMWSRMWARSRRRAAWFINQDVEPQLNKLQAIIGTGGVPVYLPPGGLSASPFASLMGRPVIPVEYAKTLGTEGDILLADWSMYKGIRKGEGVDVNSSIHVRFLEGETAFRAIYRVDGQPKWREALTPANGTNTLSPFVTLATRA